MLKSLYRHPDARIAAWSVAIVAVWRLCLEILNQVVVPYMRPLPHGPFVDAMASSTKLIPGLHRWQAWDVGWYEHIAHSGYGLVTTRGVTGYQSTAFFPLYPLLLRVARDITGLPFGVVGMAMNLVFLSVAVFFLYKLTLLLARNRSRDPYALARFAVVLLLLNPSALFFATIYTEALLVMLSTMSIYFALRKNYWWAALCAGIATGSKVIAVVLAPAILILYIYDHRAELRQFKDFIKHHVWRLAALSIMSASGLEVYMLYLWRRFHDPLFFSHEESYWSRHTSFSVATLRHLWRAYYAHLNHHHEIYTLLLVAIPIWALVAVVWLFARHGWRYAWLAVMIGLCVLIPISTGSLVSLNRYILMLSPVAAYVAVYMYGSERAFLRRATVGWVWVSTAMLASLTVLFLAQYFAG